MLIWYENDTFTKAHADFIKSQGASERVYDFVGRTIRECIEKEPWAALVYAPDLLTPETLDWCAEQEPWVALGYAEHLITPERLERCKKVLDY